MPPQASRSQLRSLHMVWIEFYSSALKLSTVSRGLSSNCISPGVHWLQDPRSGVYNFTTWLESIPNVKDFAFDRITGFVSSSADEVYSPLTAIRLLELTLHMPKQDLWKLARQEGRKFTGSTSSLSGMLSHVYFLLSGFKDVDTRSLSRHFQDEVCHISFIALTPL